MKANLNSYVLFYPLYVTAITLDRTFDSEVLEIDGFLLRARLAVGEVTDEWIGLEPPDEKTAEGAQVYDNLLAMQAGFTKSALGTLEFMLDRTYIRTSEAARFAGELQGVLPTMMNFLDEPAKNQLREPIKGAASKETDPVLKRALVDLLSAMK